MEEELRNSALRPASAETGQVAEVPQQGRTRQDSYYADRRRKQQLDQARERISHLEQQLSQMGRGTEADRAGSQSAREQAQAEARADNTDLQAVESENKTESRTDILTDGVPDSRQIGELTPAENQADALRRLVADGSYRDNPQFLKAEMRAMLQDISRAQGLADAINHQQIRRQMDEDLRRIQQLDPAVLSLDDLPDCYTALRFNSAAPLTARQAYLATGRIQAVLEAKPQSTGSMTGGGRVEREYYTADELDRLTSKDLSNPAVMEKAMKSLSRLG